MSKPIVLLGDMGLDHEGFPPTPVTAGSPDVFVDGKPVARVGDPLAPHSKPKHPPHPRVIASGSTTVLINGVPAAITGGTISCGGFTMGSGSVVIGDAHTPHPVSPPTPFPARNPAAVDPDDPDESPASGVQAQSAITAAAGPAASSGVAGASAGTPSVPGAATAAEAVAPDKELLEPGFHIVQRAMSRNELLGELYGDASLAPDRFDYLNPELGDRVTAGMMVVLGDPEGLECTEEENLLIELSHQVNARVNELTEDEAQFVVDHYDLIETITSTTAAGVGAGSVMISRQLQGIVYNLRDLEALHQESYRKHGNLSNPEFFEKRRAIFNRLDFSLGKFARKSLSLDSSDKLKRALGLSSKSIVHDWKQAGVGDIPGYSTHYERVSSAGKYMARGGYLAIGLDASVSLHKVNEACKSERADECRVVTYQEAGRFSGSVMGGSMGGGAAALCGFAGLASGGVLGIACAVLVGGIGSYAGGKYGGSIGSEIGDLMREVIHD